MDTVNIVIGQWDGVSQAIKKQLKAEGIEDDQFTGSIWSKIQQALNDGNSVIQHGNKETKIGELWTSLQQNVKTYVNDVLKIDGDTWNNIKNLFSATPTSRTNNTKPEEVVDKQWQEPDPYNPEHVKQPPQIKFSELPDNSEAFHQRICDAIENDLVEYDDDGVPVEISFPNEGIDISMHYYENNGKISRFSEKHLGNDGKPERVIIRDGNHSVIRFYECEYNGGVKSKEIVYNPTGKVTDVVDYYPDGKTVKQITSYNDDGTVKCIETYNRKGNPTRFYYPVGDPPYNEQHYEIIEYKADGETVKTKTKYNLDGNPMPE